jgi:hypothetical protein
MLEDAFDAGEGKSSRARWSDSSHHFQTRYGGTYEGGRWAAIYSHPHDFPEEAWGGDTVAAIWWVDHAHEVGVGESPNDALEDLRRKPRR